MHLLCVSLTPTIPNYFCRLPYIVIFNCWLLVTERKFRKFKKNLTMPTTSNHPKFTHQYLKKLTDLEASFSVGSRANCSPRHKNPPGQACPRSALHISILRPYQVRFVGVAPISRVGPTLIIPDKTVHGDAKLFSIRSYAREFRIAQIYDDDI